MTSDLLHRRLQRRIFVRPIPEREEVLLERAARVFRLSTEIMALQDPGEIPSRVVEALVEELQFPVASMVLEDPDTGKLIYVADQGVPEAVKAMGFREGGTSMSVFRSGQAAFMEDMGHDPTANPKARPFFQAYACLPIRNHDRTFGLLFVNYGEPHRFTPAERNILNSFAIQTAIALDNARLRRTEIKRSAALAGLANLSRDLSRSLDPTDLMRVLERTLRDQFPSLQVVVFWLCQEDHLHFIPVAGREAPPSPPAPMATASEALSALVDSGGVRPIPTLAALKAHGLDEGLFPEGLGEGEGLILPLSTQDRLEGVVGLLLPGSSALLGDADQDFLRALGDRAALAFHNARLYAITRRAAERDGMTQVLNRATFLRQMEAALEEALRQGHPLALLMLDADHFKRCNDQHGHAFGDRVLMALASTLRLQIRQSDGVGRLGGEEFAVFLAGADLGRACHVAERIRMAMEELRLDSPEGQPVSAPTVSQGIAMAPDHGRTASDLLLRADAALYRAKAGGRNRTCVAAPDGGPEPGLQVIRSCS